MPRISQTWVLRPVSEQENGSFVVILPDGFASEISGASIVLADGSVIDIETDIDSTERLQANLIRRSEG